jgi:hypothetical protein
MLKNRPVWLETFKGRGYLGNLRTDKRIILKWKTSNLILIL